MKSNSLSSIKKIISSQKINFPDSSEKNYSSVLMILKEIDHQLGIYFIKRAEFPDDKFSGHVAFPGGKRIEGDFTPLDTAVRETFEEIGVDIINNGEILGNLDAVNPFTPSVSHYIVCPYVSILYEDVEFTKNYEVDDIFWVPILHLINPKNRDVRVRYRDGNEINDYIFKYENYIIWGLTGRILNQFFNKISTLF